MSTDQERFSQFVKFHNENPTIFGHLKEMAINVKRTGREHWGIRNLWEKLRYDLAVETRSDETYSLNNNFPPFYARLLMLSVPTLRDFFEVRGDLDVNFDDLLSGVS